MMLMREVLQMKLDELYRQHENKYAVDIEEFVQIAHVEQ